MRIPAPPTNGSWRALLEGDLASAALAAAHAIAAESNALTTPLPPQASATTAASWRAALGTGAAGQALLHGYLTLHATDARHAGRALELLDRATDCVAAVPLNESLYSGFTGIAWAAEHLWGRLGERVGDAGDEVDQGVLSLLSASPWAGEYDLVNGLAGLGVLALERLPRPAAARCLELVVERLGERAERSAEGAAWFSPPERLLDFQRRRYPHGCYNLGAAHGAAGVLALLAGCCRAGVGAAAPLLEDAVRWLLAHELPPEHGFRFPDRFSPSAAPRGGRLAWCHGDLGMAAALAAAARAAELPAWLRAAHDLALAAAARPLGSSGVRDAGLCHGAAGVAHLFNRLYQARGDERLGNAARRWVAHTLELRQPGRGAGGFRSWRAGMAGQGEWRDDPGFLNGAAGIGLVLLAAASPLEPEWDRVLLASLPTMRTSSPSGDPI
jgi:hypothetical protein